MLLKKCDEATQSIDVPSLESIDSEVRMYFQQQNDDWSPTLSDSDETNELVSIEIVRLVFHYFFLAKSIFRSLWLDFVRFLQGWVKLIIRFASSRIFTYSQVSSEQAELSEQALIKQSNVKVVQWESLGIFPQNS